MSNGLWNKRQIFLYTIDNEDCAKHSLSPFNSCLLNFPLSFRKPKSWSNTSTVSPQTRLNKRFGPKLAHLSEHPGSPRNWTIWHSSVYVDPSSYHINMKFIVKTTRAYLHGPDILGLCLIFSLLFFGSAWVDLLTNTLKKNDFKV